MIVVPKHTSTAHPCVHGCGTRYVVTRRTDGGLWLRYTPREVERCGECTRTDKAEKAGGEKDNPDLNMYISRGQFSDSHIVCGNKIKNLLDFLGNRSIIKEAS